MSNQDNHLHVQSPKVIKASVDLTDLSAIYEEASILSNNQKIWYTKQKKVTFPVQLLKFEDIAIYESVQLNFYQKYIILLLQRGIRIANKVDLVEKISKLLNVAIIFVDEFIDFLLVHSYLNFDQSTNLYKIDRSLHFTINQNLDNAMFADLSIKKADCNKIIYISEFSGFFLESDFSDSIFTRKGTNDSKITKILPPNIISNVSNSKKLISELIFKYFSTTNFHLTKDFTFKLCENTQSEYLLEFEANLLYQYDKITKISKIDRILIDHDNILPLHFIEKLLSEYHIDKSLPKFIELTDYFYNSINLASQEIDKNQSLSEQVKRELVPTEESLKETQLKLRNQSDISKTKITELNKEIYILEHKVAEINESIAINEKLIEESTPTDNELIINFKKTLRNLFLEKNIVEKNTNELIINRNKMTTEISNDLKQLELLVESKKEKIESLKSQIEDFNNQEIHNSAMVDEIIDKNRKKLNHHIKTVIDKYPYSKNNFFRYITEICFKLDRAISASEVNALEPVAFELTGIRDYYDRVLKVIFDLLLNKNEKNLGSYLGDGFNREGLKSIFNKRGVKISVLQNLIKFNEIINAISHKEDNGKERERNKIAILEFKKMIHKERETILLTLPDFFNGLSLTKTEINSIISRLKI